MFFFFLTLLVSASLLGIASIIVTAKMPSDAELFAAWRWVSYIGLTTVIFFVVVTFIDGLWWLVPALAFGMATWNAGGGFAESERNYRFKQHGPTV